MIHHDVEQAMSLLDGSGVVCENPMSEADNVDYGATVARAGSSTVRFRVGKVTPLKAGLFVALWRRSSAGSTEPFPAEDVDVLVVAAREGDRFGVFVLARTVLVEHGILSVDGTGGKRGFRIYPPWAPVTSGQAERSQRWHCHCFVEIGPEVVVERARLDRLLRSSS